MRDQRGMSVAVEAAIVVPVATLFLGLVVLLAGQALLMQRVESAAYQAARAASLQVDPQQAERAAQEAAEVELEAGALACVDPQLTVDVSGLKAPIGTPAAVEVSLSCTAQFPISLPGFPTMRRLSATGSSPVDSYRSRHEG